MMILIKIYKITILISKITNIWIKIISKITNMG